MTEGTMMQRLFLFLGVLMCSAAPGRGAGDLPLDGGEDGWSSAWRVQVDGVMGGRYVPRETIRLSKGLADEIEKQVIGVVGISRQQECLALHGKH